MSDKAVGGVHGGRQDTAEQGGAAGSGTFLPGPDAMLGMWSSWMQAASTSAQQLGQTWGQDWSKGLPGVGNQWWQAAPDALTSSASAGALSGR